MASASAGTVIGRYVVLETLGSGGMGTVLRAYDPKLHREVALKRLRAGSFEAEASARLVREAQALAQLSHPNVISVYDVEPTPDDVIVALELVRGATLGRWLRTPRTWREVVQVLVQAGRGLAAAHDANLIHRDFKPANVMISEQGQVKVMDFGLAKVRVTEDASESDAAREDARVHLRHPEALEAAPSITTRADVVLGTPPYMAPEQHVGTAASPSVDQYAFCVTLWSSLTGERPFHGDADMDALLRAKLEGPPPWPRSCAAPRRVVDAIRRGLAADPRARWPDMQALLEQLELALRRRRSRWRSLAGAALLGGGVFAG
ncbi:MAG: serine/threonine protein kinase, partial [Myxococcales bacterium]|nr:serine/threonine protein kinase [Myxococcales bacterium]